jgi:hypothetical protein
MTKLGDGTGNKIIDLFVIILAQGLSPVGIFF